MTIDVMTAGSIRQMRARKNKRSFRDPSLRPLLKDERQHKPAEHEEKNNRAGAVASDSEKLVAPSEFQRLHRRRDQCSLQSGRTEKISLPNMEQRHHQRCDAARRLQIGEELGFSPGADVQLMPPKPPPSPPSTQSAGKQQPESARVRRQHAVFDLV